VGGAVCITIAMLPHFDREWVNRCVATNTTHKESPFRDQSQSTDFNYTFPEQLWCHNWRWRWQNRVEVMVKRHGLDRIARGVEAALQHYLLS